MWKSTVAILLFLAFAVEIIQSNHILVNGQKDSHHDDDIETEKLPLFIESIRKLHRGPPEQSLETRATITTQWIDQKLDNFNESDTRTWKMRYMINDEYYKEGGPIFIYVGGEWAITPGSISSGHFVDIAKEHNAILYYTEHRYYGQSKPTSDITVDNLKYLNVKQALADLAHFIRSMKGSNSSLANAKVIMAGGSYAATMVVWFKRLYPELLDGGWASSAPLLAKVDFREYKEVVGQAMLELGGQQCYDRIENGIHELETMLTNKRGAEVKAMMKLCNSFDEWNDLDRWTLFASISNIFAGIVQYQDDGDVPIVCEYLLNLFNDDATALASLVLLYSGLSSSGCLDVSYKDDITYMLDSTYAWGASRPWFYQTCNEYGWYQSSGSSRQPFGRSFPATLYTMMCYDIFGDQYTNERINQFTTETNTYFGGMNPDVKNIYMTHGGLDPWNPMGHGVAEGATVITNASHCADFKSLSNDDSVEMRKTKERIAELIREWIQ